METSPYVAAQFSIMRDMYIYGCSKRNWTGSPDASVRLSIFRIKRVIQLTVQSLYLYCLVERAVYSCTHIQYSTYIKETFSHERERERPVKNQILDIILSVLVGVPSLIASPQVKQPTGKTPSTADCQLTPGYTSKNLESYIS